MYSTYMNNIHVHKIIVSVSLTINIKGGGVHQWYTIFGQMCCKTVFFSINFNIKGWGSRTKEWGSAMVPPFEENTGIHVY